MAVRTQIGRMRHVVTIRSFTRAKGAGGYAADTATTFASGVAAEVTPPDAVGNEQFQAMELTALSVYLVKIRYLFGVLPKMTIVWHDAEDLTLQIHEVSNPDGRRRFLMLKCGLAQ